MLVHVNCLYKYQYVVLTIVNCLLLVSCINNNYIIGGVKGAKGAKGAPGS